VDVASDSPPAGLLRQLETRTPGQLHDSFPPQTFGFALNTRTPPFNDIRVRRALNYAVDRDEMVRILGGPQLAQVTCQILPPGNPGYRRYCPYSRPVSTSGAWTAPDNRLAQRLVRDSGTRGDRVTVWTTDVVPNAEPSARYLVAALRRLHYRVDLRVIPDDLDAYFHSVQDPQGNESVQIAFSGWIADYPAPSGILIPLFSCASVPAGTAFGPNVSRFCDRVVEKEIRTAVVLQSSDPSAAGEAWARVDRTIVDQAPWLSLPTALQVYFTSTRTGNVQVNPQWGMLLGQLWIQ
jgi:peptide/nickel transport system substrate-binding protein